jgi:hypothetical protein
VIGRRCNYCEYQGLQRLAEARGHVCSVRPATVGPFMDGVDIYVHPVEYTPPENRTLGNPGEWWAAWLAKLPERCECVWG